MKERIAYFRFYEELNDFLPGSKRKISFPHCFSGNQSVKDIIESIGIPHTEVDLILVNGESVGFSYRIKNEDIVSVYPSFESLDISGVSHLRERPLRVTKFVADVHLGKLARYLRLCGFDTFYNTSLNDREIIDISLTEKRIILTRDRVLLKNSSVTHGYWLRSSDPASQLREVAERFDLRKQVRLFTRCMECNSLLEQVAKKDIIQRLQPMTRRYYRKFLICPSCNNIYWNGSHYKNMKNKIRECLVRADNNP